MEDIKSKMFNYETTPPEGVWNSIVKVLDGNEAKVIPLPRKRNKNFAYMAAASVVTLLFCLIFFINRFSNSSNDEFVAATASTPINKSDSGGNHTNVIMTVPIEETPKTINKVEFAESQSQNKLKKTGSQLKTKEVFNDKVFVDKNVIASNAVTSRYMTIEGPRGESIKVSSKMATLIDSSETKLSSKPVWNKKIDEWREIMKVNTLAPTTGNFLDIIELTKTLKDKN